MDERFELLMKLCRAFARGEGTPDEFILKALRVTWHKSLPQLEDLLFRAMTFLYADWSSGDTSELEFRQQVSELVDMFQPGKVDLC